MSIMLLNEVGNLSRLLVFPLLFFLLFVFYNNNFSNSWLLYEP